MAHASVSTGELLSLLAATPQLFAEVSTGLAAEHLQTRPESDAWSLNEVLAHLRACADVWGGYIDRLLTEDRPAFRSVSPRTYIRQTDYPDLEFGISLAAYTAQREELLTLLHELWPASWERAADVTGSGTRSRERTVHSFVEQLARHEQVHHQQITDVAAPLRAGT